MIVERYQDMAVGYAFSVLRDFHLAQDAAQEAFIEAYPALAKVHGLRAFPSWLRRIVFKHCDRLTRKERRYEFLSVEVALSLPSREPLPDRIVEDREMLNLLNDAVDDLPEREREIVSLFYISDQSQNDIATFLDVPVSTVKNRLRSARNGRIADSHFDWKTSRMGMVDGEIATYVGVYSLNFQIGDAVVRAAGINWLDVDDTIADEKVLHDTVGEALEAMAANGYDIAVTRGERPDRLEPHGFVYGMPIQETYYVDVADLPVEAPDVTLERVHANAIASRKDLAELYNRDHKGQTGCSIRPTYHRGKCPPNDNEDYPAYIFKDEDGKVVGYLYDGPFRDKEVFTHSDSAGDPEQVLRVLAQKVREYKIDRVRFIKMPYRSPLARRIRQGMYTRETVKVMHNGRNVSQVRLIDLRSTLEKIAPVLTGRLSRSHLAGWIGVLTIGAAGQDASLVIENGGVRVADSVASDHAVRGGQEVAQLLIGTEAPDEVCEGGGIEVSGDAAELLEVLFPAQRPQMPNEDL